MRRILPAVQKASESPSMRQQERAPRRVGYWLSVVRNVDHGLIIWRCLLELSINMGLREVTPVDRRPPELMIGGAAPVVHRRATESGFTRSKPS